jgi:hypothetical protein
MRINALTNVWVYVQKMSDPGIKPIVTILR